MIHSVFASSSGVCVVCCIELFTSKPHARLLLRVFGARLRIASPALGVGWDGDVDFLPCCDTHQENFCHLDAQPFEAEHNNHIIHVGHAVMRACHVSCGSGMVRQAIFSVVHPPVRNMMPTDGGGYDGIGGDNDRHDGHDNREHDDNFERRRSRAWLLSHQSWEQSGSGAKSTYDPIRRVYRVGERGEAVQISKHEHALVFVVVGLSLLVRTTQHQLSSPLGLSRPPRIQ